MLSGSAMGKNALSRPPVSTTPARLGRGSAKFRIRFFASRWSMAGNRENTSAVAPDTCGVAIEVPLKLE